MAVLCTSGPGEGGRMVFALLLRAWLTLETEREEGHSLPGPLVDKAPASVGPMQVGAIGARGELK